MVTLSPIFKVVRFVQVENGLLKLEDALQGRALKFTMVRPVQLLKAELRMEVTLLGMVTEVMPVQFLKALSPMEMTVDGIETLPPEPIYASKFVLLLSEKAKSPSVTPFIVKAPQKLPVAVP